MGRGPQKSPNLVYSPATFRNKGKKISREEMGEKIVHPGPTLPMGLRLYFRRKKKISWLCLFEAKYVFYTFVLGFELLYSENL